MPLYEYMCADCGPFEALAPMERYAEPCTCPDCGGAAPRALLTAPRMATMDSARRNAFETNERSRHAPRHSTAEGRAHGHGPGCSCCSGPKAKTATAANGAKAFPSKRPWMISH
jgi:putative FmdB family regulatory protein